METPRTVRPPTAPYGAASTTSTTASGDDRQVAELKAEISETRAELQETVSEIQDRLSPSHLKEQATDAVREATIGRVQHMMNRAEDTFGQAAETTREAAGSVLDTVRANPLPYALIAIGAAWLITSNRGSRRSTSGSRDRESAWGTPSYEYEAGSYGSSSGYASREYGAGASTSPQETSSGVLGDAAEVARRQAEVVRERARDVAWQARNRWESILNDNPMALGVAALAAGALVGAALPATQVESRYMGEARDAVIDSAREAAQTAVDKVAGEQQPL